jgi:vacuolar-type H+-ATPase subunit D/Vma8
MNKRQLRKQFFTGSVDVIEKPKVNLDATNINAVEVPFMNHHGVDASSHSHALARLCASKKHNKNASLPILRSGNCSTIGLNKFA